MAKKFLVAVDGSDHGWKALELATSLSKAFDAELVIVHVIPYVSMPRQFQRFAEAEGIPVGDWERRYHYDRTIGDAVTREAEGRTRKNGHDRVKTHIAEGNPAEEIVSLAKSTGAEMLFLGSRGFGDFKGLIMGSVSQRVMHHAHCTCVTVR